MVTKIQGHQDYSESQTGQRDRGFQQISKEKAKEGEASLEKTAESPENCLERIWGQSTHRLVESGLCRL